MAMSQTQNFYIKNPAQRLAFIKQQQAQKQVQQSTSQLSPEQQQVIQSQTAINKDISIWETRLKDLESGYEQLKEGGISREERFAKRDYEDRINEANVVLGSLRQSYQKGLTQNEALQLASRAGSKTTTTTVTTPSKIVPTNSRLTAGQIIDQLRQEGKPVTTVNVNAVVEQRTGIPAQEYYKQELQAGETRASKDVERNLPKEGFYNIETNQIVSAPNFKPIIKGAGSPLPSNIIKVQIDPRTGKVIEDISQYYKEQNILTQTIDFNNLNGTEKLVYTTEAVQQPYDALGIKQEQVRRENLVEGGTFKAGVIGADIMISKAIPSYETVKQSGQEVNKLLFGSIFGKQAGTIYESAQQKLIKTKPYIYSDIFLKSAYEDIRTNPVENAAIFGVSFGIGSAIGLGTKAAQGVGYAVKGVKGAVAVTKAIKYTSLVGGLGLGGYYGYTTYKDIQLVKQTQGIEVAIGQAGITAKNFAIFGIGAGLGTKAGVSLYREKLTLIKPKAVNVFKDVVTLQKGGYSKVRFTIQQYISPAKLIRETRFGARQEYQLTKGLNRKVEATLLATETGNVFGFKTQQKRTIYEALNLAKINKDLGILGSPSKLKFGDYGGKRLGAILGKSEEFNIKLGGKSNLNLLGKPVQVTEDLIAIETSSISAKSQEILLRDLAELRTKRPVKSEDASKFLETSATYGRGKLESGDFAAIRRDGKKIYVSTKPPAISSKLNIFDIVTKSIEAKQKSETANRILYGEIVGKSPRGRTTVSLRGVTEIVEPKADDFYSVFGSNGLVQKAPTTLSPIQESAIAQAKLSSVPKVSTPSKVTSTGNILSQKLELKTAVNLKSSMKESEKLSSDMKSITKPIEVTLQKPAQKSTQRVVQLETPRLVERTMDKVITKQAQTPAQKTLQKPVQKLTNRIITPSINMIVPITPPTKTPPTYYPPKLNLRTPSTPRGRYEVSVRRFGKFKSIGIFGSLREALGTGVGRVKNTLAATFKISNGRVGQPQGFYSKASKDGLLLIQKRSGRLGSTGEKMEIQSYKRLKKIKGGKIF